MWRGILTAALVCTAASASDSLVGSLLPDDSGATKWEQFGNVIGKDDRKPVNNRSGWTVSVGQVVQAVDGKIKTTCTGTIVGAKLVLTASHCVAFTKTNKLDPKTETYFLPSVIKGKMPAGAKPLKSVDVFTGRGQGHALDSDWAILLLESAPTSKDLKKFPSVPVAGTKRNAQKKALVSVGYSYDFEDGETAGSAGNCTILGGLTDGSFAHDCDYDHGASGGPIVTQVNGVTTIVGTNTAQIDPEKLAEIQEKLGEDIPAFNIGTTTEQYLDTLKKLQDKYGK